MNVLDVVSKVIHDRSSHRDRGPVDITDAVPTSDESDATTATAIEIDDKFFPSEQVLALLEGYGGRMWQQDIVDETDYSAGKVSQLLTEMEENGQISRYWKNGKKVVCYPDRGPRSPAQ